MHYYEVSVKDSGKSNSESKKKKRKKENCTSQSNVTTQSLCTRAHIYHTDRLTQNHTTNAAEETDVQMTALLDIKVIFKDTVLLPSSSLFLVSSL